jgi:hypothetical protein
MGVMIFQIWNAELRKGEGTVGTQSWNVIFAWRRIFFCVERITYDIVKCWRQGCVLFVSLISNVIGGEKHVSGFICAVRAFVCQKNEIFGNHCMTRHCTRNMLRHRTAFVFVEFQFRPRCAGTRQRLERGVSASARGISGIAGICIVFPLIPMVGLRLWVGFG